MQDITVTTTVSTSAKKQITTTLTAVDKQFLEDLQAEFVAPSLATGKDKPLTAEEAISLIFKVATDYRFDNLGNDRFEAEAQAIFGNRAAVAKAAKLERLRRQMEELLG